MSDTPTDPTAPATPAPEPANIGDVLPNARHERFAQLMALGKHSITSAYKECYPDSDDDSCRASGPRLLANVSVRERVDFLKRAGASHTAMTLEEWRKFHEDAVRTPIADIDEHHYLAQEVTYAIEGGPQGKLKVGKTQDEGNEKRRPVIVVKKVKMVSKTDSAEQLAKHHGWHKPPEVKLGASDDLLSFLKRIRKPGIPKEPAAPPPA